LILDAEAAALSAHAADLERAEEAAAKAKAKVHGYTMFKQSEAAAAAEVALEVAPKKPQIQNPKTKNQYPSPKSQVPNPKARILNPKTLTPEP